MQHSWWVPRSGQPGFRVMPSTARVNTNSVTEGWPTRLEDPGASTSPIVTDTLYHDGFVTNLAVAWGGHPTKKADSGFQIQGGAAESISPRFRRRPRRPRAQRQNRLAPLRKLDQLLLSAVDTSTKWCPLRAGFARSLYVLPHNYRQMLCKYVVSSLTVLALINSLGGEFGEPADRFKAELQRFLATFLSTNREVPGVALHIDSELLGVSWSGAAGVIDLVTKAPLTPENPVRIASNTKTFVATSILRLAEDGFLELDASISRYLPPELVKALVRGGYLPEQISVRHLLTHTSGIFDFSQSPAYDRMYEENPKYRWTRAEQVQGAMDWGRPYGAPGKVFSYSDTGYILLGEILERKTGQSMGRAIKQLVQYEKHGITSTWQEIFEREPENLRPRAHQYDGEKDTYCDDASIDLYGGGGLVSTVKDLSAFMRVVFTGKVYSKPETLQTMLIPYPAETVGPPAYGVAQQLGAYGMGVRLRRWKVSQCTLTVDIGERSRPMLQSCERALQRP